MKQKYIDKNTIHNLEKEEKFQRTEKEIYMQKYEVHEGKVERRDKRLNTLSTTLND